MKNYCFREIELDKLGQATESGVTAILQIVDYPKSMEFGKASSHAILSILRTIQSLTDEQIGNEFLPAAKRHKEVIFKFCSQILEISKLNGVSNPVSSVHRDRIVFFDGLGFEEKEIHPRSYWECYKLLGFISYCESSEQLVALLMVVTGLFTFYKRVSIQGPLMDEATMVHVAEQTTTELQDSHGTEAIQRHCEFMEHIDACVQGSEQPRTKAAREVVAWVKRVQRKFKRPQLTVDNLPVQTHSSGMSMLGVEGSVPAILASAFECLSDADLEKINYPGFDTLAGYTPPKCIKRSGTTVRLTRSVCIPHRSKDDVRMIHSACNQLQDRMHFHSLVMGQWLKLNPSIAVWDQTHAVEKIENAFRLKGIRASSALDLHASTDTLSRGEQHYNYRFILKWSGYNDEEVDIIANHWLKVMSNDINLLLPFSHKTITYKMATGQPMGWESSVHSLNMNHYLWIMSVLHHAELDGDTEHELVEVLGDDSDTLMNYDHSMRFTNDYIELMAELNTECNLSKGYCYNAEIEGRDYPIAEFAKNLICYGINVTPIPVGALSKCHDSLGLLGFITWFKSTMKIDKIDVNKITNLFPEKYKTLIFLCCCCPTRSQFSYLAWDVSSKTGELPVWRNKDTRVLLSVAIPLLRQITMLDIANELSKDPNYIPSISDYNSFIRSWRPLARYAINHRDELENNKLIALLDRLELTAMAQSISLMDVMDGIMPSKDNDIVDLIPSIVNIRSDEDIQHLVELFNLLNSVDQFLSGEYGPEWTYYDVADKPADDKIWKNVYNLLSRFGKLDFNPTNRRFGARADNVAQGLDLDRLLKASQDYMHQLGVKPEDVMDTISYISETYCEQEYRYSWETVTVEQEQENSEFWDNLLN